MKLVSLLLAGAFCAIPLAASAQWQWLDAGGRKVFSDKAPPPDVPDSKILKRPGGMTVRAAQPTAANNAGPATAAAPIAAGAAAPAVAAAPPASAPVEAPKPAVGQDRELQERLKQAEAAEAAKKKAETERAAKVRAENCERAKQAKASLDSGVRIAQVNAKGEREIMDDAARAAETRRVQQSIQSECAR